MLFKPYISLIIPTHNREKYLKNLLDNILTLKDQTKFEIVVVDNNSNDGTVELVKNYSDKVRYVFEKNTSFTKARKTGAENAKGEIIIYLDDDVILESGCIDEAYRIFKEKEDCAVVGGKILPFFEQEPPEWVLDLQKSFNGLSLYDLGDELKIVDAIPGPFMAIRKKVFEEIGGFPPDTVGVETNSAKKTFKKLYIGPGDYGFCILCRERGYKIYYSPKIKLQHVIPPFRLTKEFWISRMVGEGHCAVLFRINEPSFKRDKFSEFRHNLFLFSKYIKHFFSAKLKRIKNEKIPLIPDEIWFEYYWSFLKMKKTLIRNKGLAEYIWQLGYQGIADDNFDSVLSKLPKDYQKLAL